MALPVSLRAVVDEMDLLSGEGGLHAFLNRRTGEIVGGTEDQLSSAEDADWDGDDDEELADSAEDDEDVEDWESEEIERLQEVLASDDWLELPRSDSREDYRIMERFCLHACEGDLQVELLSAIQGRGAFGRFKDALHRHGIQDKWYAFRGERLEEVAKSWLEMNEIEYTD